MFLIRHGETQGYSTDSGLTPQGAWQAHTYGHTMAKRIRSGETVVLRHADTNRARETAEHIQRGLATAWSSSRSTITHPRARADGRVPQLPVRLARRPEGRHRRIPRVLRVREAYERMSTGDRPLWLVEIDRFWTLQVAGATRSSTG